jgi:hypothetical protein
MWMLTKGYINFMWMLTKEYISFMLLVVAILEILFSVLHTNLRFYIILRAKINML